MVKAFVNAIGDGAVVVERRKHVLHGHKDVFEAVNIQKGFLLSGKRSVREVFCRGAGADRDRQISRPGGHKLLVVSFNFGLECLGKRRVDNPLSDLRTTFRQLVGIIGIQGLQQFFDPRIQTAVTQKFPKSLGRRGEAPWNPDASLGELTDHFSQ